MCRATSIGKNSETKRLTKSNGDVISGDGVNWVNIDSCWRSYL